MEFDRAGNYFQTRSKQICQIFEYFPHVLHFSQIAASSISDWFLYPRLTGNSANIAIYKCSPLVFLTS